MILLIRSFFDLLPLLLLLLAAASSRGLIFESGSRSDLFSLISSSGIVSWPGRLLVIRRRVGSGVLDACSGSIVSASAAASPCCCCCCCSDCCGWSGGRSGSDSGGTCESGLKVKVGSSLDSGAEGVPVIVWISSLLYFSSSGSRLIVLALTTPSLVATSDSLASVSRPSHIPSCHAPSSFGTRDFIDALKLIVSPNSQIVD